MVIKDLLDVSLKSRMLLEIEYFPLRHFFIVFEHLLLHGFNAKRSFGISNRKDLWTLVEIINRVSNEPQSTEIFLSIKEITNIRTNLGRFRAWLRLALMQKRLAHYFQILTEQKQELNELYDSCALILSDENVIITGLLVGLNVLDFNFYLKESVLDTPTELPIHYSLYLRERRLLEDQAACSMVSSSNIEDSVSEGQSNETDGNLSYILDQKNYLEEINRNLEFVLYL